MYGELIYNFSGGVEITIQGNGFSAVGEVKDDNQVTLHGLI